MNASLFKLSFIIWHFVEVIVSWALKGQLEAENLRMIIFLLINQSIYRPWSTCFLPEEPVAENVPAD